MRSTLSADRCREHFEAHAQGDTITQLHLRAEHVVDWATRGGSKALGTDSLVGSLEAGKKADIVLIKNDDSSVMFPILNPYGHVVFQTQRGDVDTVMVNGRIVKRDHKLVGMDLPAARRNIEATVDYLVGAMGRAAWEKGMYPDIPETKIQENPYTYTNWDSGSAQWKH
jgi:5-methylthioadenosine/S-adenosylhomocysteine deaminase